MSGTKPETTQGVLLGREREHAAIDGLLERAANRESGSLVIRGEPGIGKSALLSYAQEAASGAHDLTLGAPLERQIVSCPWRRLAPPTRTR